MEDQVAAAPDREAVGVLVRLCLGLFREDLEPAAFLDSVRTELGSASLLADVVSLLELSEPLEASAHPADVEREVHERAADVLARFGTEPSTAWDSPVVLDPFHHVPEHLPPEAPEEAVVAVLVTAARAVRDGRVSPAAAAHEVWDRAQDHLASSPYVGDLLQLTDKWDHIELRDETDEEIRQLFREVLAELTPDGR